MFGCGKHKQWFIYYFSAAVFVRVSPNETLIEYAISIEFSAHNFRNIISQIQIFAHDGVRSIKFVKYYGNPMQKTTCVFVYLKRAFYIYI